MATKINIITLRLHLLTLLILIITNFANANVNLCSTYDNVSPDLVITNGTYSSTLSNGVFKGLKIEIIGDFLIDTDIKFENCIIELNGDMRFESSTALQFDMIGCKVYSCVEEWSIQTFSSPNSHNLFLANCVFQNFGQALRLRGSRISLFKCTFDGGIDYSHGTVDLHNCTTSGDVHIEFNTFNQISGGTAIHSEGSELFIIYNTFNSGRHGVNVEDSKVDFVDNIFNGTGIGIRSSESTVIVRKRIGQNLINFNNCSIGIQSRDDNALDVTDQTFKCGVDNDISNTLFARFSSNKYFDPILNLRRKSNIISRATNLVLSNNKFYNNYQYSLGVDVNGGNLRAVGNIQSRGSSTPYFAYNLANAAVIFDNNNLYNGTSRVNSVISGSYSDNILTNNLSRDAWISEISPAGLYCDNTITSPMSRGMFFDGNNINTTLSTTTFGNCKTGIEINEVLGRQDRRGNKWIGSYSNVGATYTGDF